MLICIKRSRPCTLRFTLTIVVVFIHDVYRNYFTKESFFAIISVKVVSQRSVFVTFDLIVVTKILEHKWQSDRRRRIVVRQDSETQQRNYVKVILAKCRLSSSKSRVQKKWRDDSTDDPSNYIDWIIWKFDETIRERTFHQYNMKFLCSVDYAFVLTFIFQNIEMTFTLIFSKSLLFVCFQESSDNVISLNPVEEYEIVKKISGLKNVFNVFEIATKSNIQPNKTKK